VRPAVPFRDRAQLFAFVGLLAALNGFSDRLLLELKTTGVAHALLDLGGISAVGWFAFCAVVSIACEDGLAQQPGRRDLAIAGLVALLCLIPWASASAIAVLVCGVYASLSAEAGSRSRRIGVILLAFTGPLLWGQILLAWFAPLILGLDARLAGMSAGVPVSGNVLQDVPILHGLYIAPGCSSLHNMSLAVLLWATLLQLFRLRSTPYLVGVGVTGAVAMALVNIVRIAAIVRYPANYTYLHSGTGAELFAWLSLVVAAVIIGGGILVASRARD
jgi:exosortase/archaeosortase family protein